MAKKRPRVPGTPSLAYTPPRRFNTDPNSDYVFKLAQSLPRGLFSIVSNENARYTAFHGAMSNLILPIGARIGFHTGCYVVDSCNRAVQGMKEDEDWLAFMGDDHIFPPELMLRLLALMYGDDLDIIVPLCFKRSFPPEPVLYVWKDDADREDPMGLRPIRLDDYPDGGVIEVDAAGTAGMVIRRRVLDKLGSPWFSLGDTQEFRWGEDLYFCYKAKKEGFKVWADLDMSLGHILNTTIWPVRKQGGGEWACQYDFGTQGGFVLGLDPVAEE